MKKGLLYFLNLVVNICYGRNITITTATGVYALRTTLGHPLKRYLHNFKKYDRFLPYLSKAIAKSVIDIGSNIGDTLVLIKSVSNAEVICVEPDKSFLRYLQQNIERNGFSAVQLYPYPISSVNKTVSIEKNALKSTSHMKEAASRDLPLTVPTKTFRDLLTDLGVDINSVGIIKSDTDGYDWDCLNSIADYFDSAGNRHYPEFIFYEHQTYLNNLGKADPDAHNRELWYEHSLRRLVKHGYSEFYVFDNFGSLIQSAKSLEEFLPIAEELMKSGSRNKASRYFLDVLITQPATAHIVERALHLQAMENMTVN